MEFICSCRHGVCRRMLIFQMGVLFQSCNFGCPLGNPKKSTIKESVFWISESLIRCWIYSIWIIRKWTWLIYKIKKNRQRKMIPLNMFEGTFRENKADLSSSIWENPWKSLKMARNGKDSTVLIVLSGKILLHAAFKNIFLSWSKSSYQCSLSFPPTARKLSVLVLFDW